VILSNKKKNLYTRIQTWFVLQNKTKNVGEDSYCLCTMDRRSDIATAAARYNNNNDGIFTYFFLLEIPRRSKEVLSHEEKFSAIYTR